MDGKRRRKKIIEILKQEKVPISGTELARRAGVSRQVIVQDVALLRAEDLEIISTYKGYILHRISKEEKHDCVRIFCATHEKEDTLDELQTIVDYGGRLLNVFIEHEVYGQIQVDLIINNRLDALEFVNLLEKSDNKLLNVLTGGCHYHTVAADSTKNLDRIEMELKKKGYLV